MVLKKMAIIWWTSATSSQLYLSKNRNKKREQEFTMVLGRELY